jgi:hypothetical protein
MSLFKKYNWLLHVIGWAIFMAGPFLVFPVQYFNERLQKIFFFVQILETIPIITFFYLNLHRFTPQLIQNRNYGRFWVNILIWLIIICLLSQFTILTFLKPELSNLKGNFPFRNPPQNNTLFRPFNPIMFRVVLTFIFMTLLSSIIVVIQDSYKVREAQKGILLEKIASELEVLKLQISPHFLFNTLNNIRWLARQKSDKTEDAIVRLSTLLRYILYQANAEKVPLSQEIKHLEDYISLQKMRLTERTEVDFKYVGDIGQFQIEPLIFIPFVENSFKYGVHNQASSKIKIYLKVSKNYLIFETENQIFEQSLEAESGIGIQNVQRRLEMLYPEKHTLEISEKNKIFELKLTINL